MRSPSYPSTDLGQAIELVEKIFSSDRTNPVDREVAAEAMGYTGVTGQSAKILSNLLQYGLLEKAGKNEVRVTSRALSILLPDDHQEKSSALREAIEEPVLFQRIRERFEDGLPSESALRSLLLKEGFTDAAIPSAVRAFMKSYEFLQDANVCDGHGRWLSDAPDSPEHKAIEEIPVSTTQRESVDTARQTSRDPRENFQESDSPTFFFDGKRIDLGGSVLDQEQAEKVVQYINAIKMMLPPKRADGEGAGEPTEH